MSGDAARESTLDELFDAHYLRFYRDWHTTQTADESGLVLACFADAAQRGARLLDLGCGEGRMAFELAEAGLDVVGVDRSRVMLDAARGRSADATPRFVRGDLRELPLAPATFDLALSWFTSFGFGPTDRDDRALLRSVASSLRPGGVLVLETVNRDQLVAAAQDSTSWEALRDGDEILLDERRFDPHTGRLHVERLVTNGAERIRRRFSMRLFTGAELTDWLLEAGFGEVELLGDEAEPFELADGRMIARATIRETDRDG